MRLNLRRDVQQPCQNVRLQHVRRQHPRLERPKKRHLPQCATTLSRPAQLLRLLGPRLRARHRLRRRRDRSQLRYRSARRLVHNQRDRKLRRLAPNRRPNLLRQSLSNVRLPRLSQRVPHLPQRRSHRRIRIRRRSPSRKFQSTNRLANEQRVCAARFVLMCVSGGRGPPGLGHLVRSLFPAH